jgi:hypothetical protein
VIGESGNLAEKVGRCGAQVEPVPVDGDIGASDVVPSSPRRLTSSSSAATSSTALPPVDAVALASDALRRLLDARVP